MMQYVGWGGCGVSIVALVIVIIAVRQRCRQRNRLYRALIDSFEKPLLLYNEYGQLVFYSSGLILFDRKSALQQIRKPPAQPTRNQPQTGEIEIDHNRYRFRSQLLEYRPEVFAVLVLLDYQGSATART